MKHDLFEEELKALPWRSPSSELGDRIAQAARESERNIIHVLFTQPIALGRVAALVLCAGLIGFGMGKIGGDRSASGVVLGDVDLQIIDTGVSDNFFDMGDIGQDLLPGTLEFEVQETEEVGI